MRTPCTFCRLKIAEPYKRPFCFIQFIHTLILSRSVLRLRSTIAIMPLYVNTVVNIPENLGIYYRMHSSPSPSTGSGSSNSSPYASASPSPTRPSNNFYDPSSTSGSANFGTLVTQPPPPMSSHYGSPKTTNGSWVPNCNATPFVPSNSGTPSPSFGSSPASSPQARGFQARTFPKGKSFAVQNESYKRRRTPKDCL
uniref:Nuclear receptor domain-containing protein n=1 Tax=Panagrellus redivivus TaxID=6233 RepID=A0A7E4VIW9_PANRE